MTRVVYVDDPQSPDDGKILEADIELNAVDSHLLLPGEVAPATTVCRSTCSRW